MTFKKVLGDSEGRALVDAIEDTLGSLRGQENEPALRRLLEKQIDELEARTGYRYKAYADWLENTSAEVS